jgi:hypothetical protein
VEYGAEGKRRFLVASRAQFWRRYRDMLPQHRHYYEIIRQGAPCHLYFGGRGLDGWQCIACCIAHYTMLPESDVLEVWLLASASWFLV